ncbi:MAG: hypothetical protein NTV16_05025 [Actinobacteria bacterium]|nr:hypothetical protein [Actinomycetota bacterium]
MKTDRKIIKPRKQFKKIVLLTGTYAIFAAIISFSVIFIINNSIVTHTDDVSNIKSAAESSYITTSSVNSVDTKYMSGSKLTNVPVDAINISFSYDGKYCAYIYNNAIYIKDIALDTTINKISDSDDINNFILMNNQNIVIYFTTKDTFLNVKTFNIESNITTLQKTINIQKGTAVKQVDYSSLTNLILINTESGNGSSLVNRIYRVNIMKRLAILEINTITNNMILLNNTFTLYYEDYNNNLYCYPKPIEGFNKKKIRLLGCDLNDNVFVQSLDKKGTIYVLKNQKIEKTISLNDPLYKEIYANKIGVYLVYSNYLINLADDTNKKIPLDKDLKFIGIGGDKIYFRDSNDNIIAKNNDI